MDKLSDEELVEKVKQGKDEAYGLLIERYEDKIKRYGRRFLLAPEDLEDKIQDIFLKAYKNIQGFDSKKRFSPWIYRIAHNEFINFIKRKDRSHISFVDPDIIFPHSISEENTEERIKKEEIKEMAEVCLKEINPKYREPLILYYFEDLTYEEIAEVLRIPSSTVGIRLKRGRERMKKICKIKKYE